MNSKIEKVNISNYSLEDLRRFSIFELRDMAAYCGVHAPTTHSKSALVELVYDAKQKGITYENSVVATPKRGRPTKQAKKEYILNDNSAKNLRNEEFNSLRECQVPYEASLNTNEDIDMQYRNYRDKQKNCGDLTLANEAIASGEFNVYIGVLELNPKGFGFLRAKYTGNDPINDAHVDNLIIRVLGLRNGDMLKGVGKRESDDKAASLFFVIEVNGISIDKFNRRPYFDSLVPIFPDERLKLESIDGRSDVAIRCIDLMAPIGRGQRALIVAPPKAGKTTLLKLIANSIINNYPDVKVFVLLIDERPEEVTDMQRSINAEVVYSTFDEEPEHHVKMASIVLDSAKRYVESGKDAVIVLDSLTRLARAYNQTVEYSGRSLSGGLDPSALSAPKRFFGSARNIENGGSLTIIATALIETGSRLDDVIFEEFKGTGNMEVVLDRKLSERRIFPAIDLAKSGTRREDLLLSDQEMEVTSDIRSMLDRDSQDVIDILLKNIYETKNNQEFMIKFSKTFKALKDKGYTIPKNLRFN